MKGNSQQMNLPGGQGVHVCTVWLFCAACTMFLQLLLVVQLWSVLWQAPLATYFKPSRFTRKAGE